MAAIRAAFDAGLLVVPGGWAAGSADRNLVDGELPFVRLYYTKSIVAAQPWFRNFYANANGLIWSSSFLWVTGD